MKILFYSEGPGTSRYEVLRSTSCLDSDTEAANFMRAFRNFNAVWEVVSA